MLLLLASRATHSGGIAWRTGLLAIAYLMNVFLLPLGAALKLDTQAWYV